MSTLFRIIYPIENDDEWRDIYNAAIRNDARLTLEMLYEIGLPKDRARLLHKALRAAKRIEAVGNGSTAGFRFTESGIEWLRKRAHPHAGKTRWSTRNGSTRVG